ncbi:MAG: flagellar hook assembly protein FlgD [Nitrospirota bacterium]|jgi:flagellar basal-body rod modification protein FlgD|nr:flagellar hook assembly protein FlgD [Nitrospirota bacterium]MDH4360593.1 flagellar hook assembly protein FlgD [Nitrospirota bacterium]MDH5576141.1 flagellar hook assembly protein FlgD [Nitrospirota bacterium]
MDSITPTQSGSNATANANVQAAVSTLGSDVFLRLLVTQLQSQDPTNPVKNEDFVAQLAQFTTLEQTTSTNKLLEQLIGQDTQRTQLDLVNLIGRTVVSQGDTVSVGKDDQPILAYALSGAANRVNIEVLGPNNSVIRTLSSTAPETPGTHQVQWDGLNESGDRVPEGVYQFRVKAEDASQQVVPNFTFARERVMNIAFGTESPVVVQSGKTLNTQDIILIQ